MPVTVNLPDVVWPPRVSVYVPPPFARWPGPAFSWPLPLMASVEPSAAMAASDDPGGTAPITHVYDAWLSAAWPAKAGAAAPTVRVLATTMAAKSILFISSPPVGALSLPKIRKCIRSTDIRLKGHIPSAAALPSRVRARLRRSSVAQCRRRLKNRAGMGAGHAGAQVTDAGHVTGSPAAAGGGGRLERRLRLGA